MASEAASLPEHRGIKRIQRACLNCRRKKAKCSGDRPTCSCCQKMSQECYWDTGTARLQQAQENSELATSDQDDLASRPSKDGSLQARVGAIETKMDDLLKTINVFLPVLLSQTNPGASPAASRPPISSNGSQPIHEDPRVNRTEQYLGKHMYGTPKIQTAMLIVDSSFRDLPPPEILQSLIDVYFLRVHNQPYSFFHEGNFRGRLSIGQLPNHLLYAVLATALRFSSSNYYNGREKEAASSYAGNAWKELVYSWFANESEPEISICQTITLLSIIDFTAGRHHPAWLKIGLSIRIAQDLRLMMEPDTRLPIEDQEERRRVFWSIYALDKFCSCGRARPSAVIDAHCRTHLPGTEDDFRNGRWQHTQTLDWAASSSESLYPRVGGLASVALMASIIGRCAQNTLHEHAHDRDSVPPWNSKSEYATISSTLFQLETQLEIGGSIVDILRRDAMSGGSINMQVAGPIVFARALFHTCQCLLHHPFLLYQQSKVKGMKAPVSFLNRALQTSREHAISMSSLLQEVKSFGCEIHYSFMGYCTTVCGSVHALYLHHDNSTLQQQGIEGLDRAKEFLFQSSKYWWNAGNMLNVLQNLEANYLSFQPLSSLAASDLSSGIEGFEPPASEAFWSALDYTSMSQTVATLIPPPLSNGVSPNRPFVADLETITACDQGPQYFGQPKQCSAQPFNNLSSEGLTPLTSFFGASTMNFGG